MLQHYSDHVRRRETETKTFRRRLWHELDVLRKNINPRATWCTVAGVKGNILLRLSALDPLLMYRRWGRH